MLDLRRRRPRLTWGAGVGIIGPVLLGAGKRLLSHLGNRTVELERTSVIESPYGTHVVFTVRH